MRALKLGLLVLSLTAAVPALAANFFCCTDDRGKQACGDILPAVCIGRAYREIGPSGAVLRHVEAPLTAEQRARRTAEEERKKEAEAAAKEQNRLDQALLQTYGSEADIDAARRRAEADTVAAIKVAETKIVDARKRRKKFESEAEFYKKKELPPQLAKALKENDAEILAQQALIETKTKDLETIRAKYDDDKRRYHELRRSPTPRLQ